MFAVKSLGEPDRIDARMQAVTQVPAAGGEAEDDG
jgi:hypothetical protein